VSGWHTVPATSRIQLSNVLAVPIHVSIAHTIVVTLRDTKLETCEGIGSRFLRRYFRLNWLNHHHCLVILSVYWATRRKRMFECQRLETMSLDSVTYHCQRMTQTYPRSPARESQLKGLHPRCCWGLGQQQLVWPTRGRREGF
jgi:hypothetical protein